MASKRKNIVFIFFVVFTLGLAALFYAKHIAKTKFEDMVDNLPKHIDLQYDATDFDIISGNFKLKKPLLIIKGKVTKAINIQIVLKTFEITDLSYWELYKNDVIDIESVRLSEPKITYYHNKMVEGHSYDDVFNGNSNKTFSIGMFNMDNASLKVFDVDNDSILLSSESLNLQLSSVESKLLETSKLPFACDDFLLTLENTTYQLNEFENLSIKSIAINTQNSKLSKVKIKTKYSKKELSKYRKTERDHFDLSVASIYIKNQKLITEKHSKIGFKASDVILDTLNLDLYRNKLIADDIKRKSLYSKILRDLNFSLDLNSIKINNGQIIYEEKVKLDKQAGKLEFSNLEAKINNVSNMNEFEKQTTIHINSTFMKNTPLTVDWNFDVNDANDAFIFKVDLGILKADHLNQFMQPNLNLKLEGELIKTYFTIDGNANTSIVDLKTNYNQFDVVMLKENGKEKNKFLSGLVNLFISKNSKDDSNNFSESNTKTVERDKTKSIFNFVWKNAQAGLLSAMVGDGKKND